MDSMDTNRIINRIAKGKRNLLENIYPENAPTKELQHVLKEWNQQKDYYGPWWDGIEKFHFELAKKVDTCALEVSGWYKYPSSTREDMDGKDWRQIVPNKENLPTIINCHSILHDNVWTLTTTIHSTKQIDILNMDWLHNDSIWHRSMLWTRKVMQGLSIQGYKYKSAIEWIDRRLDYLKGIESLKLEIEQEILDKQMELGQVNYYPGYIFLGMNDWIMRKGAIASYWDSRDLGQAKEDQALIILSPKVMDRSEEYLRHVLVHELCHAATGRPCKEDGGHCDAFIELATAMGLPKKYQD